MTSSCVFLVYRALCVAFVTAVSALVLHPLAHAQAPPPKVLHVAAAADLQPVLPKLAALYEQQTGVKIVASFGSSATLEQQLLNGDPQDVFLSADTAHPADLIAHGLAADSAPIVYASGILVLWARKDSPAQPLSIDALTKSTVQRIAVANDKHAPYGQAATAAIASLHLTAALAPKLVVAENIAQTAQFVESGNAQAGFISLTTASTPHFEEVGTFVRLPAGSYPPLRQSAVTMKASKNLVLAHDFLRWLTSAPVQQSLPKYGLEAAS